jgi:propionyl-CoA carboxylase alpha chain
MGRVPALIRKLLIANRGEIAVRIARTAQSLGISTVAVYTEVDRDALHVTRADEAVRVESYLDRASILQAARCSAADAIHPGYGFLAENPDFAEACEKSGIVFVGPKPDVIRQMALKDTARAVAIQAGVPVAPEGGAFPLLIKAAAGGGGRGMRIVRSSEELESAEASARSEAERAFGNGALLHEQYIQNARHVEVQIFGDHHGNVVHLWERDCSVQRRYQKIIEESPSPALTSELRSKMCDAAVALGHAIGYTNAGTVEFLLAPSGEFYFIEVNTRIQVEHPVTEMVTNLDLIRMQIEVAEGRPIDLGGVRPCGHAIEARLYAEDPANDFLPSTGTLHAWRMPEAVRVDTAMQAGSEVGVHYDPMLAKVIAWAPDRERAIRKLALALRTMAVGGVETNREFLIQVMEHEDFRQGRAHTAWKLDYVRDDSNDEGAAQAVADFIAREHRARLGDLAFWRNNPWREPAITLEVAGKHVAHALVRAASPLLATQAAYDVTRIDENLYYVGSTAVRRVPRFPESASKPQHETANSPMPGVVLRVAVTEGQTVKAGDPLLVLEAMKMEQTIKTTIDGRVAAILVKPGQVVAPGQMLVEIDSTENAHEHTSHSTGGD